VTPTQKFVLTLLGIIVPAAVTVAGYVLNRADAAANARKALAAYDTTATAAVHTAVMESPQARRPGSRTNLSAVAESSARAAMDDTAHVVVQPSRIGRVFGARATRVRVMTLQRMGK
jgi:hypothetical protein